jgi:hypothetical protein
LIHPADGVDLGRVRLDAAVAHHEA